MRNSIFVQIPNAKNYFSEISLDSCLIKIFKLIQDVSERVFLVKLSDNEPFDFSFLGSDGQTSEHG